MVSCRTRRSLTPLASSQRAARALDELVARIMVSTSDLSQDGVVVQELGGQVGHA